MSNLKRDLMKEINARVAKKKQLAVKAAHQKTAAKYIADYFIEYEKTKGIFAYSYLDNLQYQLRRIDDKCVAVLVETNEPPTIEVHWSDAFVAANNCEKVLVLDSSSALFQSAMEEI